MLVHQRVDPPDSRPRCLGSHLLSDGNHGPGPGEALRPGATGAGNEGGCFPGGVPCLANKRDCSYHMFQHIL